MYYKQYETDCFVLKGFDTREANRFILLLSRELGPIWAEAKGIRKIDSKLRYNLQSFSRTKAVLLQGREVWRVVGASGAHSYWQELKGRQKEKILLKRLFDMAGRLLIGEEKREDFFLVLENVVEELLLKNVYSEEDILMIELIALLRLLLILGYVEETEEIKAVKNGKIDSGLILKTKPYKEKFLFSVNKGLKAAPL